MADEFLQQLEDDLDCFLNQSEFAVTLEYHGVLQSEIKSIAGLWDTPFATSSPGTESVVQGTQPTMRVKEHELPGGIVRPGDYFIITAPSLVVDGKEYLCKESQPDGVGLVTIDVKVK